MFGLGIWEVAVILVVALLVLGPERLPKVARQLGRGLREVRRAARDFQTNITAELDEPPPPPPKRDNSDKSPS